VTAAPAGLAATVSQGVISSASVCAGVGSLSHFMSIGKIQLGIFAALMIGAATTITWQRRTNLKLHEEVSLLQTENQQVAVLREERNAANAQVSTDQQRAAHFARDIAALQREIETLKANQAAQPTAPTADTTSPMASDQQHNASTLASDEIRVLALTTAAKAATDAYRAAYHGQQPPNPEALIPYFATPEEGADWVELLEGQKGAEKK
jgi:hypothetical protein